MKMPATNVMVFNVAAGLVTIAALGAVMKSILISPTATPCSERYANATFFALERAGVVLTAADLQSGLGGRDAGVLDNVAIARAKDGPAPVALSVSLPKGSASPRLTGEVKGGMSFPWEPRAARSKTAACLSYQVLLPADFEFGRGGTLPGLRGAEAAEQPEDGFVAPMVWRSRGRGGTTMRLTHGGETRSWPAEREAFTFPRGRWVKLEQEIVLNTPKKADGTLRVWVDGSLVIERSDIVYRTKPEVAMSGVAADVFFSEDGGAPKDTVVRLSPFELRWQ